MGVPGSEETFRKLHNRFCSTPGGQLQSADSIDQVLSHEVKELGTHILVCEVSYTAPGKSKMNFRKFFKFNVMKPLDVKTKFYNAEVRFRF